MHLCTKILVKAVKTDMFGQQFITDAELIETSLVGDDHRHEPIHHVQVGDVIYVENPPLVIGS